MKNLQTILCSLLTIAVITIFTTSCNQSETLTDEIAEVNLTTLSERLAQNSNFQASIKTHDKIGADLMTFIKESNVAIDDQVISSFINSYAVSENELAQLRANLLNDFPELQSISEQAFDDAVSLAFNLLSDPVLILRNCPDMYRHCTRAAYMKYYYGYSSYNIFYYDYTICVQQYYNCI